MNPPGRLREAWRRAVVWFLLGTAVLPAALLPAAEPAFPPFYHGTAPFREALAAVGLEPVNPAPLGLTVPHHILAADLIADTLSLARGGNYERIVIVSPDHFKRVEKAAAVAGRDFLTVLGPVPTDHEASARLAANPRIGMSSLASHEHGFRAILPFLAEWFPGVPVVTVAVGIRTTPEDWRHLADALDPVVSDRTLLVQSTDFSHYLPPEQARIRDAETLADLATGDPDRIPNLDQPANIDSKAAQWIQMELMRRRGARHAVVENRNSVHYAAPGQEIRETTSYVTQVWTRDFLPARHLPGEAWYFGGDFHLGRHLAGRMGDPGVADRIDQKLLGLTGGAPLVLNLEGAMTANPPDPDSLHPMQIVMSTAETVATLKRWKVAGVVLANNHSLDLGAETLAAMTARLRREGFVVVGEGETVTFPRFELWAASDVQNLPEPAVHRLRAADFPEAGTGSGDPFRPRLAFLHWGAEYRGGPDDRQRWMVSAARKSGFDLVVGCHSHLPSRRLELVDGLPVMASLGNLLFDQGRAELGGALLEVRFFSQGTFATRVIPLGNLYREMQKRGGENR